MTLVKPTGSVNHSQPYVLFQFAGSKESAAAVADMITKTLDLQGQMADHFHPMPVDRLAALPADPTGLLARTVPANDPNVTRARSTHRTARCTFGPTR